MPNEAYDMAKLKSLKEFDVETAKKNFASKQELYDELDRFVNAAENYFSAYNPVFVIYDDGMRKNFLGDVKRVRQTLTVLHLKDLLASLADVECAVGTPCAEPLADLIMTFTIKAEHVAKTIAAARTASKPLILAVDDKPELLTAIVNMLKDNFTVMAVTNAAAAIKAFEKHTPALFLLDIEMPQVSGYQLAKTIRAQEKFAHVPIIFLTGKNSRDDVITAIRNGGNDYIVKPVDKGVLIEKIMRLI